MTSTPLRWLLLVLPLLACRSLPPHVPPEPVRDASPGDTAVPGPSELERIAELEALRSLEGGVLVGLAQSGTTIGVRVRALRALARLQAPETLPVVLASFADADPAIREEAAFAAGQFAIAWDPPSATMRAELAGALIAAEASEPELLPRLAQLEALGKVATPEVLPSLTRNLDAREERVRSRAALSLAIAAKSGVALSPVLVARLAELVDGTGPVSVRHAAAHALMRTREPARLPGLRACATDAEPEVRAVCVKGLAAAPGTEDQGLLASALADVDERVAVEAVRGLVEAGRACALRRPCAAVAALASLLPRVRSVAEGGAPARLQPVLALAQSSPPPALRPSLVAMREALDAVLSSSATRERGTLARLDCRVAAALSGLDGTLAAVQSCGGGSVAAAEALALGLGELPRIEPGAKEPAIARAKLAADLVQHADLRVRTAALNVLSAHPAPALAASVRPLLLDADPLIAASAATVLSKMQDATSAPVILQLLSNAGAVPDRALPLIEAAVTLQLREAIPMLRALLTEDPEASIRTAAADALTKLEGQPVTPPYRPRDPVATGKLATRTDSRRLRLRTEHGDIVVVLDVEAAPLTSANLTALARKGYFRNLTFHRIVPDFVVQGGDPRGTGEGGPGYTVPCEITRRPYTTGTVGMALSGKDTGGSQFFITTSPQPHLDGRYTAFGQVFEGQEVARRLLEGDRILEVVAE